MRRTIRCCAVPILLLAGLTACSPQESAVGDTVADTTTGDQLWVLPAGNGAGQPDLSLAADGRILMSWLETRPGQRTRLQLAEFDRNGHWQATRTVAVGSSFVTHAADTPHVLATADGTLWVHWLQKAAQGQGYHVLLSNSRDGGMHWNPPVRVHADTSAAEHGFVSLWAHSANQLGVAWLDGSAPPPEGASAPVTAVRSAAFDTGLHSPGELTVAAMACDCCPTAVASTAQGAVLAFRGRTGEEMRDIHTARFDGTVWTAPAAVHADGWHMTACPVNGPSLAASQDNLVAGWYTAAGGTGEVRVARSSDSGSRFQPPVTVDSGDAVLGRVQVAADAASAWVLWLREEQQQQSLWLARYSPDLVQQHEKRQIARLHGRGLGTGLPRMLLRDGVVHIVWIDLDGESGASRLHGLRHRPAG